MDEFIREVGAILDNQDRLISVFDGEPGHVDFPNELIAKLHKMNPGYIGRFTHIHPPKCGELSGQDKKMMKNLAFVMYPFPIRLGVIYEDYDGTFCENIFTCILEPKELWKVRGGEREMIITQVEYNPEVIKLNNKYYFQELFRRAYEQ